MQSYREKGRHSGSIKSQGGRREKEKKTEKKKLRAGGNGICLKRDDQKHSTCLRPSRTKGEAGWRFDKKRESSTGLAGTQQRYKLEIRLKLRARTGIRCGPKRGRRCSLRKRPPQKKFLGGGKGSCALADPKTVEPEAESQGDVWDAQEKSLYWEGRKGKAGTNVPGRTSVRK